jgi:hypothetical protein
MQLTLSPDEARELRDILTGVISDLRSEIHHTDSPEFKERLMSRERLLRRLSEQLDTVEALP